MELMIGWIKEESWMKDISQLLEKASLEANQYDSKHISRAIEKVPNIWCRLEDDSNFNWYLIGKNDGESVVSYYGYLSSKFPVALLTEDCPDAVYRILSVSGISIDKYCKRYSCRADVLRRYVNDIELIDDSFLYDDSLQFDEEIFLKIDEGTRYINPRNFSFDEIK